MNILMSHLLMCSILLCCVNSKSICQLPNTGTVLFRYIDIYQRDCWNVEELALLYTKRAMMDLIPHKIPHNVPLILEYIQICLTTLREEVTDKKVYNYMLAALVDTFGGYLQTFGLPLMHKAYYEGYVSYENAAEFHMLQDNFKNLLMTNGEGWTSAMEVRKHINLILPLKIPTTVKTHCCSLLLKSSNQQTENVSLIPLPILDDNKQPNSIAIPFNNHVLYNLKSRSSYDILIKYYIEASRCITQFHDRHKYQLEFDKEFSDWLREKILPHLKENVWFVGFSNVFRITETIQQKGGLVGMALTEEKDDMPTLLSKLESELQLTPVAYTAIYTIIFLSILVICLLYSSLLKIIFLFCFYKSTHVEPSKENTSIDESDNTSLLSSIYQRYQTSSQDSTDVSQIERSASEESKLYLGKGFSFGRNTGPKNSLSSTTLTRHN